VLSTALRAVACDRQTLNVQCHDGDNIIVISANYGRRDTGTCPGVRTPVQVRGLTTTSASSAPRWSLSGANVTATPTVHSTRQSLALIHATTPANTSKSPTFVNQVNRKWSFKIIILILFC